MGYQTILVHCDAGKKVSCHLDVAAELAGRFGSVFVGLHAQPPFETPAFAEGAFAMGPIYKAYEEGAKADLTASRGAFDKALKGKHLPTEWRVIDDYAEEALTMAARYADLLVVGQATPDNDVGTPVTCPKRGVGHGPTGHGGSSHRCGQTARQEGDAVLERQPRERARRLRCHAFPQGR